ncbi:MAG: carbohydrate kinase [Gemmatimonadetes bacterium]|nr:carbohydrate kinase [Gemmatimonadota bacterium]
MTGRPSQQLRAPRPSRRSKKIVPVRPVIVSVGEIMWDRFPEEAQLSGAPTNVAIHAAALGAESWLVSAVGNDSLGNMALGRLDAAGVHRETVAQDRSHPTGTVLMKLDSKGTLKYDFAANVAWDHMVWSPRIDQVVKRAEALTFGTLSQRSQMSRDTVRHAAGATSPRAWRLFDVNLRQSFYDSETIRTSLTLANAVKLNEHELPEVARRCGVKGATDSDVLLALCDKFALRLAVLTRGTRGALLRSHTLSVEVSAPQAEVVDFVGSGEAFTAALLVGLLEGLSLDQVGTKACALAAYVRSQPRATPEIPPEYR